jgi:hypothetical protein
VNHAGRSTQLAGAVSPPRAGNTADEYEDAPPPTSRPAGSPWPTALGKLFRWCVGPPPRGWLLSATPDRGPLAAEARRRWKAEQQSESMPWYMQERFEERAFATLLGAAGSADAAAVGREAIGGRLLPLPGPRRSHGPRLSPKTVRKSLPIGRRC